MLLEGNNSNDNPKQQLMKTVIYFWFLTLLDWFGFM